MVNDIFVAIMLTIGSLFILIAALGILRMPDFYLRLTVTVKAATFGIGFILGAAAIHFNDFSVSTKAFSIIFFLILTAPVAGHMIGKTAYKTGVKLWKDSVLDDLGEANAEAKNRQKRHRDHHKEHQPSTKDNHSDSAV